MVFNIYPINGSGVGYFQSDNRFFRLEWWFEENRVDLETYAELLFGNDNDLAQELYSKMEDSIIECFNISEKFAYNIIRKGIINVAKDEFKKERQYNLKI